MMELNRERLENVPYAEVPDDYRYVNAPLDYCTARMEGRITPTMFDVLQWVRKKAGYYIGTVGRASASIIQREWWPDKKDQPSLSTIQRAIKMCARCGYISLPTILDYRDARKSRTSSSLRVLKSREGAHPIGR